MEDKIYPKEVLEISNKVYSTLGDDFFTDEEVYDLELGKLCALSVLNELFLNKFIKGENLLFKDEEEAVSIMTDIIISCHLKSLEKKGLLNSYVDDTMNEPVFFVTDKGKMVAEQLRNDDK